MASNVDILTRSHTVAKRKARAKRNEIDQILFDEEARHEYLTGFRKRNLLKKEAAKIKAKERERQERLQARKEQRRALQERARQNVQLVESAFRKEIDEGDGDDFEDGASAGFSTLDKGKRKAIQEYEDEEQLATVTVVEEFDPDSLRHIPSTSRSSPEPLFSNSELSSHARSSPRETKGRISGEQQLGKSRREAGPTHSPVKAFAKTSATTATTRKNILRKKVACETKAGRKAARQKQRARKAEKAERAGGKSRRKGKDRGKNGKKGR